VRIVLRIDREVRHPDGSSECETRYALTSLDPACNGPEELAGRLRAHWQIENCLHHVKDRWWDEDRHWLKRPGLAERFAALLNAALAALRLSDAFAGDMPMRARADSVAWRPRLGLKLLGLDDS
jgi:hypothetical protein